jgi:solute carrier family 45 protein 1/2/4
VHRHKYTHGTPSAWFAWFPARAYATLYVGELFKRSHPLPSFASESDILALDAEATRLGSRALFFSSVLSLGMNIVLPFLVAGAKGEGREVVSPMRGWLARAGMQVHLASLWAFSLAVFAGCMIATL